MRKVRGLRYGEVRCNETPTGFARQHVLRGTAPNGQPLEVPAAIFCTIAEGKRVIPMDDMVSKIETSVAAR